MRPYTVALLSLLVAACVDEPSYDGLTCSDDAPCPEGYTCDDGVCRQDCTVNQDCGFDDRICVQGLCQPDLPIVLDGGSPPGADGGSTSPDGAVADAAPVDAGGPECQRNADCIDPGSCEVASGATCNNGVCIYEALACVTPPPSECVQQDSVFRTYAVPGSCDSVNGTCAYSPRDVACASCQRTCLAPCQGIVCNDVAGGCKSNGACTPRGPGLPAECVYNVANDGASCTLSGGDPGTCRSGSCVECVLTSDCNDNNSCTDDRCDPATARCVYSNNTAPCNDGDACTRIDQCAGGRCRGDAPIICNMPPNSCYGSVGTCTTGLCDYSVNTGSSCNDGQACTRNDSCRSSGACQGTAFTCTDNDACTSNDCNGSGCNFPRRGPPNLSPSNNQVVSTDQVTLSWSACSGASRYQVEIQFLRGDGQWIGYFTYEPTSASRAFYPCSNAAPAAPCNGDLRFRVRAYTGSFGPWSSWARWHWNNCRAC